MKAGDQYPEALKAPRRFLVRNKREEKTLGKPLSKKID